MDLKCPMLNRDVKPYKKCENKPAYRCKSLGSSNDSKVIAKTWDGVCRDHYLDYIDEGIGLVAGVIFEKIEEPKSHQITVYESDLDAVRKKYLQLSREIGARAGHESHLEHSVSKLGIFLQDIFGQKLWLQE